MSLLAALLLAAPPVVADCQGEFGPSRRFEGVWLDEFEGQYFFAGARSRGDLIADARRVGIDVDLDDAFRRGFARPALGHAYRVVVEGAPRLQARSPACGPHAVDDRSGYIRRARLICWQDLGPARQLR